MVDIVSFLAGCFWIFLMPTYQKHAIYQVLIYTFEVIANILSTPDGFENTVSNDFKHILAGVSK